LERATVVDAKDIPPDEVEKRSNLDVFWELKDDLEGRFEGSVNADSAKQHFY
jgi:hypothetical protein